MRLLFPIPARSSATGHSSAALRRNRIQSQINPTLERSNVHIMKAITQGASSGTRFNQCSQSAASSLLKVALLSLGVLVGASAPLHAQTAFFNDGAVHVFNSGQSWTNVAIGDTVGKTHVAIYGGSSTASGMFRLGRGSFASAPPSPPPLLPPPDFCALVLTNSATLTISGSGHLCLGGVLGSGNEVIVTNGSDLVTPKIHLGGMQARATTLTDITDNNRVLVQGSGSTLTITGDGAGDALFIGVSAGFADLDVYGNNLTLIGGATATITGNIRISTEVDPYTGGKSNNIRIGSGSSLTWTNQSSITALDDLVANGYILFQDNYTETVIGPPGSQSEPSVRWLTRAQITAGSLGTVNVTFNPLTGSASVNYTEAP